MGDDYRSFEKHSDEIQVAKDLYKEEKYNESLGKLNAVQEELGDNSYVSYLELLKAQNHYALGDYENAEESLRNFKSFIELNRTNEKLSEELEDLELEFNIYYGFTLSHLENYDKANAYLDSAIVSLESGDESNDFKSLSELKLQKAQNLYSLANYEDSIYTFESILNDSNLDDEFLSLVYENIGLVYNKGLNDTENALAYYEKAYETNNQNITAMVEIINFYILNERNEEALELINYGMELIDKNVDFEQAEYLYTYQGILLYKQNMFVEAVHSFKNSERQITQKVMTEERKNLNSINNMYLLFIYYNLEEYPLALSIINTILSNSDDYTEEMINIANERKLEIESILNLQNGLQNQYNN